MMPDGKLTIFLSHVKEDEAIALSLKSFLEQIFLNADVFVSGKDLAGGEVWVEELRSKLGSATTIVALVSHQSIKSNWVHFEAGAGFAPKKTIPLLVDGISFSDLGPPLSLLQCRTFDKRGLTSLLNDIAILAKLRSPSKFPGLDDLLCAVTQFIELRRADRISDRGNPMVRESPREADPLLQERMTALMHVAKTSIQKAIGERRNVFELPPDSTLATMSILDLEKMAKELGIQLPFLIASRIVASSMTVPYSTDPDWKKLSYKKDLDDLESLIEKFRSNRNR